MRFHHTSDGLAADTCICGLIFMKQVQARIIFSYKVARHETTLELARVSPRHAQV